MKILAAVDQSEHATKVIDSAIELAKLKRAELTLVTVNEQFCDVLWGVPIGSQEMSEECHRRAHALVEEACAKAAQLGVVCKGEILSGISAADSILRRAEADGCDLLVVGRKGKTGIERFMMGSVATRVVTHSPCSVLVVR